MTLVRLATLAPGTRFEFVGFGSAVITGKVGALTEVTGVEVLLDRSNDGMSRPRRYPKREYWSPEMRVTAAE